MKNGTKLFFSLAFVLIAFYAGASQTLEGLQADQYLKGANKIIFSEQSGIPAFISFNEESRPVFSDPDLWLKQNLRLEAGFGLFLISKETDKLGFTHYRYSQEFNGIPLDGTMWIIHVKNNRMISMNGLLFDQIKHVTPVISEREAFQKALDFVKAEKYKWQIPEEEKLLQQMTNDPNATFKPKGKQIYAFNTNKQGRISYRLSYRYDIYAHHPLSRNYIFIDAVNGEIVDVQNRIFESNSNGTAVTGYSGIQQIITDSISGNFRLRESGRGAGQGVETYNLLKGTNYGNAIDFTDADNYWNNVNVDKDHYATDAHFAAEVTYDYFYENFGRNSIDNAGLKLLSYVHYATNYVNAFWDGLRMTYGDGNATYTPLTTLDIGGHEITHGLTGYTANLVYSYESGALNESYSDIFGTSIEWYADSTNSNWTLGEGIGSPFRSLSNPNIYGDPDTYLGTNWYTGSGDGGGVHTNSGVQNHWFYLLSVGGSGTNDFGNSFNVAGIGIAKAAAIAFRTLTVYLTPSSQYIDARNYSIQSAIDLFGPCSPEMFATWEAWYAVGVGTLINTPTTISTFGFTTLCFGDSLLLTSHASIGSSYQWYNNALPISGATNSVYKAASTGSYTVVTNVCGIIDTSNSIAVNVILLSPTISPSDSTASCDSVLLTAGNTNGYMVQWNKDNIAITGATNSTFSVKQSGNYSFTLLADIEPPQTLINSIVINVPDNTCINPASSTITVNGFPPAISTSEITIKINISQTWDGDLDILLEAPNGDILGLSNNAGGSGDDFINTIFSDAGSGPLSTGVAPFTGVFKPWPVTFASCVNSNKTSFASIGNGIINPNGNWKLHVFDGGPADLGIIQNWSITFPSLTDPSPDCGPVNSPTTTVSIGTNAIVSIAASNHYNYNWTVKNNFPGTGRKFGSAVTVNGKGYFGFGDNTFNNDWWEYNSLTDTWTQKASCPLGRSGGSSFSIGNKVYVVGGYNGVYLDSVYEWNQLSNIWTAKATFGGGVRAFMSSCVINGKGYLFCGENDTVSVKDIWEYDPGVDQWNYKLTIPLAGFNGITKLSAIAIGSSAYFGLGRACGNPCVPTLISDWFEYNPASNTVTSKSSFPGQVREGQCSFVINGKGYVAFGNSGSNEFTDVWEYDAGTNAWQQRGNYSGAGRTGSSAVTINNVAFVFSGNVSALSTQEVLQFKAISNVCTNNPSTFTLQASFGNAYLWSTGATTESITGISNGDYSVTVTNAGCSSTAFASIAVFPDPVADVFASGPLSFCSNGSVTLSTNPALEYLWSNGATTNSIFVNTSGSYSVKLTAAGECSNTSAPAIVKANTDPPVSVVPSGSTDICQGSNLSLNSYSYQPIPYSPVSGSGTNVTLTDEQVSIALPIGFSFTFFGNTYSNFYISANGFIAFTSSSSGCCLGQLLPNPQSPNNLISFAWADLYPPAGGTIDYFTTGSSPNKKLIVNFTGIPHYPSGNPVTSQLILYETTNMVEIHTTGMPSNGDEHTMGMENANGTQAVIIPSRNRQSWSAFNEGIRLNTQPLTYSWSTGSSASSITTSTAGSYSLTVTDGNGCSTSTPVINTSVIPLPTAVITPSGPTTFCSGDSIILLSNTLDSCLWSNGAISKEITVSASGNYTVTVTNSFGCSKTSDPVIVTVNNCNVSLELKLFIQGYYRGGGQMEAVADKAGHITLCDTVVVELHDTSFNHSLKHNIKGTINTNGYGIFTFPVTTYSGYYYIVIRHQNALETWSSLPINLNSPIVSYDFSDSAGKALGNNQKDLGDGNFALYNGDLNRDGYIDGLDFVIEEGVSQMFVTGYVHFDLTGDGIVESADYSLIENNYLNGISLLRP